jgi:hypothetical protein
MGHNGMQAAAVPTYPVDLLRNASWKIEATHEHSFVSLRDLDLQQTNPGLVPSVTDDLFEYDDYMQSKFNYTSLATCTLRAENSELPQNYFETEQDEGGFKSTPRGRNVKRNAVIREWLLSSASSPYPSRDQLSALAFSSGLSIRQVQICLHNLRARTKTGMSICSS